MLALVIYATSQKWKRDRRGVYLSALLKGTALGMFARLSPELRNLNKLCSNASI
jgi:hypothetical protein